MYYKVLHVNRVTKKENITGCNMRCYFAEK